MRPHTRCGLHKIWPRCYGWKTIDSGAFYSLRFSVRNSLGGYAVFFFKEAVKRGIVGEAAGFPYILEGHALQDFIFCINKAALDYAMVKGDVQLLAEQGDGKRKKI